MDDKDIALAELKMLQDIIARQDGFKDKTKTLAVALFSAASVGYFSGQLTLSAWQYFLASVGICMAFMILEGAYGSTELNAENRVEEVEDYLRGTSGSTYSGPAICEALVRSRSPRQVFQSIMRWQTRFLYLCLILLSGTAALFIIPSRPPKQEGVEKQLSQLTSISQRLDQRAVEFEARLEAISQALKANKVDQSAKKRR